MNKNFIVWTLFCIVWSAPYAIFAENLSGSYLHSNPSAKDLILALSPQPALKFRGIERQPVTPKAILDIKFDFDSTKLTEKSIPLLHKLGEAITSKELKKSSFAIVGHTDGTGTEEYNQKLSALRAQAVKNFLAEHYSVQPELLHAEGRGESELLFPEAPDNPDNRRVEIINRRGVP